MKEPVSADLQSLASRADSPGPQWGLESEDLNATLLSWRKDQGVGEHVNQEVDVLMIGVEGEGLVAIDSQTSSLTAGKALLIPKGSTRSVTAVSEVFAYLNVHKRRKKLGLGSISDRPR